MNIVSSNEYLSCAKISRYAREPNVEVSEKLHAKVTHFETFKLFSCLYYDAWMPLRYAITRYQPYLLLKTLKQYKSLEINYSVTE